MFIFNWGGAVGALIVFDVTDRDSFAHLTSWLTDARTLAWSDVSIFIVGNKIDDEENREVTMLEAASFAQENSCVECDCAEMFLVAN